MMDADRDLARRRDHDKTVERRRTEMILGGCVAIVGGSVALMAAVTGCLVILKWVGVL